MTPQMERADSGGSERETGQKVSESVWAIPLTLAVLAIAVRWWILRNTHSTTEDFLITLRYAENIAAGRGFVYNPGEHVLGTTTPLYTMILAVSALAQLDPTTVGKTLNILAEGASVLLICHLAALLGHGRAGWIAGLLYAMTSAPISISIGGMETALVTLCGLAVTVAFIEKRPIAFAVSSAILALLRIDGLLLAAILTAGWVIEQRRTGLDRNSRLDFSAMGVFLVLSLPWVLFATFYFGSHVPTSVIAKLAVYGRIRSGTLPNLETLQTQFFAGAIQSALSVLFVLGAVLLWRQHRSTRGILLWFAAYLGVILVSRVPAFAWYFLPPLPIYYLGVGIGITTIAGSAFPTAERRFALIGLILLAIPLSLHLKSVGRDIANAQDLEDRVRRPLGEWLASVAKPAESVMLEPIGYIGYYSRMRVLDIIGLVSPEVISCYGSEVPNPQRCIVDRENPDWLVLRPAERRSLDATSRPPSEGGSGRIGGEYRWVRSFPSAPDAAAFEVYRRE